MGFLDDLFGGSSESESSGTSKTVTRLPAFQRPHAERVVSLAAQGLEQPRQFFPGSTVVGFTPLQQQGQAGRVNLAQGLGGDLAGLRTTVNQLIAPQGVAGDERVAGAIQAAIRPAREQLLESILPNLRTDFNMAGSLGGERQGALEQNILRDFNREALDVSSRVALGENARREAQALSAATYAFPQLTNQLQLPSALQGQVGAEEQELQRLQLAEEISRHGFEQNELAQRLGAFAPFIFSPLGSETEGEFSQQTTTQQGGQLGQLLKAGLGIAGMAGGFGFNPFSGAAGLFGSASAAPTLGGPFTAANTGITPPGQLPAWMLPR